MLFKKASGMEVEVNDMKANIDAAVKLGWEPQGALPEYGENAAPHAYPQNEATVPPPRIEVGENAPQDEHLSDVDVDAATVASAMDTDEEIEDDEEEYEPE